MGDVVNIINFPPLSYIIFCDNLSAYINLVLLNYGLGKRFYN